MKRGLFLLMSVLLIGVWAYATDGMKKVSISIIETSDVHGNFFPYDFIERKSNSGSLARISSFVNDKRQTYGDNCILVDNGDILQGQPTAYYYNFIDTVSKHLCAEIMNYMKYDAGNMGNHDIETGKKVYDKWAKQCSFPILGANIIDKTTNKSYLPPYKILERDGVKIAILGMVTPAIPLWVPEKLWEGLEFEDIETSARKWIEILKKKEKADVIIGLFHAGKTGKKLNGISENPCLDVAKNVPGFDAILMGHDHQLENIKVKNVNGEDVLLINPAADGNYVSEVTVNLTLKNDKVISKSTEGKLVDLKKYEVDKDFIENFNSGYENIKKFVGKKITSISKSIDTKDAYFGPSEFIDLIQDLQLEISKADISFTAPLSFYSNISKGDIYVSDMFNLYKYENMLYVMKLSGSEIKNYLEMSYNNWIRTVRSENDNLLQLQKSTSTGKYIFINPSFNFDSAAGINYTVNVTKPFGQRVRILSMTNGSQFDEKKIYKVAVNSYRGNGGGDLLTAGAGIPKEELPSRIIYATDKDLRYYLMEYLGNAEELVPVKKNNWKFIPEDIAHKAASKDYILLFGNKKK